MSKPLFITLLGPLLAIIIWLCSLSAGLPAEISLTLAITTLTATWWITEAIPIPATSLVPFVLFPLAGILSYKEAAAGLGQHVIILLMGGFMIAKGLEKAHLHRRISLVILNKLGGKSARHLIFGLMISGALLSMWISNTAACLVLMPIALAILREIDDRDLYIPVVLCIAFSCNLGGIATLIGTPPNLIFAGVYQQVSGQEFSFSQWISIGFPIVVLCLPLMALYLSRNVSTVKPHSLPSIGQWSSAEKRVLWVFVLIICLWVFRLEPFGGWSGLGFSQAGDSTVALLGVVLMFLIPSGTGKSDRLLDLETALDIPWGMLLLFAGGLTIAKAFQVSGTAQWLGENMTALTDLPPLLLIFSICITVTFLTEITSNTATTTLLMPILAAAASNANIPIESLMIPAAISASCAFMLPVATAPNAIAFGTGEVTIKQMAREGLVLNLMMAIIITTVCYFQLSI